MIFCLRGQGASSAFLGVLLIMTIGILFPEPVGAEISSASKLLLEKLRLKYKTETSSPTQKFESLAERLRKKIENSQSSTQNIVAEEEPANAQTDKSPAINSFSGAEESSTIAASNPTSATSPILAESYEQTTVKEPPTTEVAAKTQDSRDDSTHKSTEPGLGILFLSSIGCLLLLNLGNSLIQAKPASGQEPGPAQILGCFFMLMFLLSAILIVKEFWPLILFIIIGSILVPNARSESSCCSCFVTIAIIIFLLAAII